MFSLLNFGARSTPVSHELHVHGVDGVVNAYRSCLKTIQLGETGCLCPPIQHVACSARKHLNGDEYFVLVILTCREISDASQTTKVTQFIIVLLPADPFAIKATSIQGYRRGIRVTDVRIDRGYWSEYLHFDESTGGKHT